MQDKNTPDLPDPVPTRTSGGTSPLRRGFLGKWGTWLVLLLSLPVTFTAWNISRNEMLQRARDRFAFRVKAIENGIHERLQAYEFLLRGGAGLFASSDEVTREEWHIYVTSLQINQYYPGIQGIGFSKRILPLEKELHVRQIRKEGFPQYAITPDGERPEYTSIVFLEPFDWRNQRAFGYDMFSEPVRKKAMAMARDTGSAAMSGKVILLQETDKDVQAGFLMYLPVYRKSELPKTPEKRRELLEGYVYSAFRMNNFMQGIFAEKGGYVELQIFDDHKLLKDGLLYESENAKGPLDHADRPHFATRKSTLEYAGHSWRLEFVSSRYFEKDMEIGITNFILWLGIAISLLLFTVVWFLNRSRNQAISLANTSLDLERANIGLKEQVAVRKQAEERIKSSLKEKEVLLSEVHHRVKNNMQVITSLLRLQSSKIEDKRYAGMFKESEYRIKSMALIHEKLYQTKDFAKIDFKDYAKDLANHLIRTYSTFAGKIKLNINIEDIPIGLDKAIPCGLIINELISNSLKYAFPKGEEGEIRIVLRRTDSHEIELTVSDDGIGISKEMDIRKTESLGLQLVHILAENQLDGTLAVDREKGTAFKIRFENH